MVQQSLMATILVIMLLGCNNEPNISFSELSKDEKALVFDLSKEYVGVPYVWGGNSNQGLDCSGLVLLSMNDAGFYYFFNAEGYSLDVNAHELWAYNTYATGSPEKGDLVFFDSNSDGRKEHVSIFSHIDEYGRLFVIDAYSVSGVVSLREAIDYQSKGYSYGSLIGLTITF